MTAAVLAGAALPAPGAAAAPPSQTCTGQDVVITPENAAAAERTLHCLINVYRADNGRSPLTWDPSLREASRRHSIDMVSRAYFDHVAPSPAPHGAEHHQRALAAGYPADEVSSGENLATGGLEMTTYELFESWRTSDLGHDENMLDPEWVTSGLGIVRGYPGDDAVGVTPEDPAEPATPASFSEGATLTGLFAARNRGFSDTASELIGGDPHGTAGPYPEEGRQPTGLGPDPGTDPPATACKREKAAVKKAGRRVAKAKKARKTSKQRSNRRAVRKSTRAFKRAKKAKQMAKRRYKKCRAGL